MNTPITDKATANPIGFYSCATVPASTCRAIEESRNELLDALERLMSLIYFADQDERSLQGDNMKEFRQQIEPLAIKAISKAKGN